MKLHLHLHLLLSLVQLELRLRLRRLSTVLVLLLVAAGTWAMILDPKTGAAMMVVNGTRTAYNSAALALGSATLSAMLLGFVGFYLVRGRVREDLRQGLASVIASTPVSSAWFLLGRWLGNVAYLSLIGGVVMLTIMLKQALIGVGAIQPLLYLQTYALMLLPLIFFCSSCALLFDSFVPLMGKFGDLLYFIVWCVVLVAQGEAGRAISTDGSAIMLFDFLGMSSIMLILLHHFGTTAIALGGGPFNPAMTPLLLPDALWWSLPIYYRLACGAVALTPLVPALLLFHRYSADKLKPSLSSGRRSPLQWLNQALRPLAALARPVFALATRVPGLGGQLIAELALSLASAPAAILALLLLPLLALAAPAASLSGLMLAATLVWLLWIADIASRDYQADTEQLVHASNGGAPSRYLRHLATPILLGWLLLLPIGLALFAHQPISLLALLVGICALSAGATVLGRSTGSARSFLALSLFWLYVATNAHDVAWIDLLGFNGAADSTSITQHALITLALLVAGYAHTIRRAR
ncbi:MAG: hypothetical protein NTY70_14330 [Burkholderiales bacterium]|nr:hypothetical protein [Burkholderiales bacterium]